MRLSFVFLFSILIIVGCCVYNVSNQYQMLNKKVQRHVSQSAQEQENIRVLQAEWAFLTNPVRMEKLATEHFDLKPIDGTQLVALNTVPMRDTMDAQEEQVMVAKNEQPVAAPVVSTMPAAQLASTAPQAGEARAVVVENVETVASAAMPAPAAMPLPTLQAIPVSAVSGQ